MMEFPREENVKLTLIWGVHFNYHQAERGPVIDFRTPSGSQWMSRVRTPPREGWMQSVAVALVIDEILESGFGRI